MEKLSHLKFDTPNNACMSLRCMAEWVRTGDILITASTEAAADCEPHSAHLMVGFAEPGRISVAKGSPR